MKSIQHPSPGVCEAVRLPEPTFPQYTPLRTATSRDTKRPSFRGILSMRQQSSEAIRRAKRRALTVELLEDRRVFSLGLVPSLPGLLSQSVSSPAVSPVTPAGLVPAETTAAPVTNVLTDTIAGAKPLLGSLPVVELESELRLDTGAGGLRMEFKVTTVVLDVVVASDLGVKL